MKRLLPVAALVATALSASACVVHPVPRAVYVAPPPAVYVAPRPVYVAPPRPPAVYIAPPVVRPGAIYVPPPARPARVVIVR